MVVLVNGEAGGRLMVDRSSDTIHVVDISLLPRYRGVGIGGELVQRVLEEAEAASLAVTCEVALDNDARGFWEHLGFRTRGVTGAYTDDGVDVRDLATLTAADFEVFVGHEFRVDVGRSDSLKVVLLRIVHLGERPGRREPFLVHFLGPRSPVLSHEIHTLVNPEFGELEIFVGPVVAEDDGTTYEAAFT